MTHKKIAMEHDKKIALVAHDNKKRDLVEWAKYNRVLSAHHKIYATGTTERIEGQVFNLDFDKRRGSLSNLPIPEFEEQNTYFALRDERRRSFPTRHAPGVIVAQFRHYVIAINKRVY